LTWRNPCFYRYGKPTFLKVKQHPREALHR
jgi:hypothetical protein